MVDELEVGLDAAVGRNYRRSCRSLVHTPHEHACLRCPLLRPDPAQLSRLTEIHTNLIARLAEAHDRGWAGEIDGLEISLAGVEHKLEQMRRSSTAQPHTVVHLATPTRGRGSQTSKHGRAHTLEFRTPLHLASLACL